jgi:hypothetical protein
MEPQPRLEKSGRLGGKNRLNILARARLVRTEPAEDNVGQQVKRPPRMRWHSRDGVVTASTLRDLPGRETSNRV